MVQQIPTQDKVVIKERVLAALQEKFPEIDVATLNAIVDTQQETVENYLKEIYR